MCTVYVAVLSHLGRIQRLVFAKGKDRLSIGNVVWPVFSHNQYKRGAIITIIRTERPDGSIQVSLTESDMQYLKARDYQQRHGLSLTKSAIKARLKTWRRLADRQAQEGFESDAGV